MLTSWLTSSCENFQAKFVEKQEVWPTKWCEPKTLWNLSTSGRCSLRFVEYICMQMIAYVFTYVHIYIEIIAYVFANMYIYWNIYRHYIYTYNLIHILKHIYIYIYTYTHIYIYNEVMCKDIFIYIYIHYIYIMRVNCNISTNLLIL